MPSIPCKVPSLGQTCCQGMLQVKSRACQERASCNQTSINQGTCTRRSTYIVHDHNIRRVLNCALPTPRGLQSALGCAVPSSARRILRRCGYRRRASNARRRRAVRRRARARARRAAACGLGLGALLFLEIGIELFKQTGRLDGWNGRFGPAPPPTAAHGVAGARAPSATRARGGSAAQKESERQAGELAGAGNNGARATRPMPRDAAAKVSVAL